MTNNNYSTMSLEEKVELQKNIILELEDMVHRTKNVLIDLLEGLYCHETQQHILYSKLSEITNNQVHWQPDTLQDTHISGNYPTTSLSNNHELRISRLESVIFNTQPQYPSLNDIEHLKMLKRQNYELLTKSLQMSEFIHLFDKLTYENQIKTKILNDLRILLESLQPEYNDMVLSIINNTDPDSLPLPVPNPHKSYLPLTIEEELDFDLDRDDDVSQRDAYTDADTDPDIDIETEINKWTCDNNRLLLQCNNLDELSDKIDNLIRHNMLNDKNIDLLKKLLKIKHPECLNIYEINEDSYPYI